MGVLSLFCCSDTTDDNEDKMQQQHQNQQQQQSKSSSTHQDRPSSRQAQNNKQIPNGSSSKNPSSSSTNSNISTTKNNNNNNVNKQIQTQPLNPNPDQILSSNEINQSENFKSRKNHNHTKKDLDDDNSINETDTITNTNEESNNHTPKSSQNVPSHEVNIHNSNNTNNISHNSNNPTNVGDIIAQASPNEQPLPTPNQPQPPIEDIDTDVDEYYGDNNNNENDDLHSNTSSLDLTRLQTGQAHDEETGSLLGFKSSKFSNKKCLILDLDETLVHSSFKYLRTADFVIPVEIDNQIHHVYVIKRPGVDEFLQKVGKLYEVVVFTASVSKYGDPLLNKLDFNNSIHHRLFRDSCYNYQGNFIKNLSQIGRPLKDIIIIDNSPASYLFHPQHSIPISSWFSDTHDNELLDLLPFLEDLAKPVVDNVALVLDISL
ncbi:uncharacterized protein KGF55_005303 [Candida pseudojiufengensis]|uniref:uncharacterized protein n=1 Tax=Candida pseudojiufengensis TaxID=497109 RepID=UPI0022258590|nr:uncharacterized protein KGF55_005303 [Candida pseudojiufengensis]KAI5959475.1 hypothetical protein KGF55_005303 [Candida pseudojiufengensis]